MEYTKIILKLLWPEFRINKFLKTYLNVVPDSCRTGKRMMWSSQNQNLKKKLIFSWTSWWTPSDMEIALPLALLLLYIWYALIINAIEKDLWSNTLFSLNHGKYIPNVIKHCHYSFWPIRMMLSSKCKGPNIKDFRIWHRTYSWKLNVPLHNFIERGHYSQCHNAEIKALKQHFKH